MMGSASPTTKRFLAVGLNKFALPGNDLQECVADAHTMQAVAGTMGIQADLLTDQGATKKNILAWLKDAVEQAKAGKLSYLGYAHSGHGTHYTAPNGGLQEAICCYNLSELNGDWNPAGLITEVEFRGLLNQVPTSCLVEVWLDTCYSQGMTRLAQPHVNIKAIHNPGNADGVLRMANQPMQQRLNSNIVVWSACSEAQESADAPNLGNGAGTYYWTKAWKHNPKACRVDVIVLQRKLIAAGGFTQVPRLACWNAEGQKAVGA